MTPVPFFQVDAFTSEPFNGNPAAVCPLEAWLPDELMQAIAAENNLSETAFFVHKSGNEYDLRWFTPTVEVKLCGHATLASAFVVMERLNPSLDEVVFHTLSDALTVSRAGARYTLDLPRLAIGEPAAPGQITGLQQAAGRHVTEAYSGESWLVVLESSDDVANLRPDQARLASLDCPYLIVTAPSDQPGIDFASRYFAPGSGIPEDPVTGSIHARLTPFWADRLGKRKLEAAQLSARGGRLYCALTGDRVKVGGEAVLVIEGQLRIP